MPRQPLVTKRRAAIYVRQSLDRTGEALAVSRQEQLCRDRAAELGWQVIDVYRDNSLSASSANVTRPAYTRMLAELEEGQVDAVVVYDLDRLTRRPIELETFVDLADRKGVALASVDREVDLATDGGRLFARIKGAVARAEVERKGRRQKDANDQRAAAGKPYAGRRSFGYTRDGMDLVEDEATALSEAAERVLSGEGLRTIVRDFTNRGIRTTAGNDFAATQLRNLLQNPRHAGLRVHRGVVVGPGVWPAVFDEDTFRAVGAVLSDPARKQPGAPGRYLLTSIATCSVCGAGIQGVRQARGGKTNVRIYQCRTRQHVVRAAQPVDDLVRAVVTERLMLPDARDAFSRPDARDSIGPLRSQEQALRARLNGLALAFADGAVDQAQLRAGTTRLRRELAAVTEKLDAAARTPDLADLIGADDVTAAWDDLPLERQRAVLSTLLDIRLAPTGRGARVFDPSTVSFAWRS